VLEQQFFEPYISSVEASARLLLDDRARYQQIIRKASIKLEQ
jgi:hypothetical protein